jgi:hypothetical protein
VLLRKAGATGINCAMWLIRLRLSHALVAVTNESIILPYMSESKCMVRIHPDHASRQPTELE